MSLSPTGASAPTLVSVHSPALPAIAPNAHSHIVRQGQTLIQNASQVASPHLSPTKPLALDDSQKEDFANLAARMFGPGRQKHIPLSVLTTTLPPVSASVPVPTTPTPAPAPQTLQQIVGTPLVIVTPPPASTPSPQPQVVSQPQPTAPAQSSPQTQAPSQATTAQTEAKTTCAQKKRKWAEIALIVATIAVTLAVLICAIGLAAGSFGMLPLMIAGACAGAVAISALIAAIVERSRQKPDPVVLGTFRKCGKIAQDMLGIVAGRARHRGHHHAPALQVRVNIAPRHLH